MPKWRNEVEAVAEAKFGEIGMQILNEQDHCYVFNQKMIANPDGHGKDIRDGSYELQLRFNGMDYAGEAFPLIQEKIWFGLKAACTGQSLNGYKRFLDKVNLTDPAGVVHLNKTTSATGKVTCLNLHKSAHLLYKALITLDTDQFSMSVILFKSTKLTNLDKLKKHMDELAELYNKVVASAPPGHMASTEATLAKVALMGLPSGFAQRCENHMIKTPWHLRTFHEVKATVKIYGYSREQWQTAQIQSGQLVVLLSLSYGH